MKNQKLAIILTGAIELSNTSEEAKAAKYADLVKTITTKTYEADYDELGTDSTAVISEEISATRRMMSNSHKAGMALVDTLNINDIHTRNDINNRINEELAKYVEVIETTETKRVKYTDYKSNYMNCKKHDYDENSKTVEVDLVTYSINEV